MVICMEKKQLLWVLMLGISLNLFAQGQIRTHTEFSTQVLVKDIFASGVCDNIDVITMIGHEDGVGFFENGLGSIGIESGIILTTGVTQNAHGPNDVTDKSTNLPGPNGDVDLSRLASGNVNDAAGIEFDFAPLDSQVQFRYVFASEEYCEFVGSPYNDVFGFFVSGPGLSGPFADGAVNVALVPGSSDYVSINTINYDENPEYYIHNEIRPDQEQCGLPIVSNPFQQAIQYDGFTQVLTARLDLIPCQTYHIRLVVGDVSDAFFDSAVFLEAGSFNVGPTISVDAIGQTAGAGQVYEGCEDASFRFTRTTDAPIDGPLTVQFHASTASTATMGLDYEVLPQEVTIPAGSTFVDLPIYSILDNLAEGDEFLRLVLDIPCACYSDSADLYIVPPPPLELALQDAFLCPDDEGQLSAQVNGGIAPIEYEWSTGSTTSTTSVPAEEGIFHTLMVNDQCGQSVIDSATVFLRDPPQAMLSGSAQICAGDTAMFPIQLEGIAPFELTLDLDGEELTIIVPQSVSAIPLSAAGQYQLLGIEDAACVGEAAGDAFLGVWEIEATADVVDLTCFGDTNGEISALVSQGSPPYELNWLQTGSTESTAQGLAAGWYELEVTDANDCVAYFEWEVAGPDQIQIEPPNCEELLVGNLKIKTEGGTGPYQYQLDDSGFWFPEDVVLEVMEAGEQYELIVQDAFGCEERFSWLMPQSYPDGMAWLPEEIKMILGTTEPLEWESYVPDNLIAQLAWTPADQLSCTGCLDPSITAIQPSEISLIIEDVFGCKQQLFSELIIDNSIKVFLPNAFSPNGDDYNDVWHIYGNEAQIERIVQLLVFDRWGNLMFQADDWPINSDRHGWNGQFRGRDLDPGVYVYSIQLRLVNGEIRTLGGDILLMR